MKIDDFTVLKVIGTGSYGKVVLSQFKSSGEIYAIKTLKKKHLIKKNQVEHTIAERSILVRFMIGLEYSDHNVGKHEAPIHY